MYSKAEVVVVGGGTTFKQTYKGREGGKIRFTKQSMPISEALPGSGLVPASRSLVYVSVTHYIKNTSLVEH